MPRTTHVLGLSGVGKTWLCKRFAARHAVVHVSASELLRAAKEAEGEPKDPEGLRRGPILDNQELLVRQFRKFRTEETRPILLDAHNVMDGGAALVEIPLAVIRDLAPHRIVFVRSEPGLIYERRASDQTRRRPTRDIQTLEEHQEFAAALARSHGVELGIPVHMVEAGDETAFATALGG